MKFQRAAVAQLTALLREPVRRIIIVTGPRQIGKTTAVRTALAHFSRNLVATDQPSTSDVQHLFDSSGFAPRSPGAAADRQWIQEMWQAARTPTAGPAILAIDEIQKIKGWASTVKGLWDDDRARGIEMHVVLLGSSPSLMRKGMNEALTGRFEQLDMTHWSLSEMQEAFDITLDQFIYFGGYPGGHYWFDDDVRWRKNTQDAMIAPSIEKDILELTRVDKPALLKRLFAVGSERSGQIVAYDKIRSDLDAANTVTLTHYVDLLHQAGLLAGLPNFTGDVLRRRASVPKFNVLNTALMTAQSSYSFKEAKADRTFWGRLVESAIGAHLLNTCVAPMQLMYWRRGDAEVDFVIRDGSRLWAVEVKSGMPDGARRWLDAFQKEYPQAQRIIVCDQIGRSLVDGVTAISIELALRLPLREWVL